MKVVLISKQIHSTFASLSSNDVFLSHFISEKDLDFEVNEGGMIVGSKIKFLNGEVISSTSGDDLYLAIYLKADETFYHKALYTRGGHGLGGKSYDETEEFKSLVESYYKRGWSKKKNKKGEKAQKDFWDREEIGFQAERKKAGLVLHMGYDNYKDKPELFQGGFSDELFNTPDLQNYLKGGGVFGWIGDSGTRRPEHDKAIEEGLRARGLSNKMMINWITSGSGRHFADSLSWNETLEGQLKNIEKNLNQMFNLSLIYGSESHGGTLKSTKEIREDYEREGILLPEDGSTFDPQGHLKLLIPFLKGMTNK